MTRVVIQPAGAEAFRIIAALYAQSFDDPWPEPSVRELLSAHGTWGLVALTGEAKDPAGFLLARVVADEAEILSIGISPHRRRTGLAKALLSAAMARMVDSGAAKVFLEVGTDNPAAMHLYFALGFFEVGRRKKYYRRPNGSYADALVLQKSLLQAS
ncbi:MAG: ribosomal protein S18-alanine N-acetyltransferase [Alphaproteobacteria bacterium]|jgi:ribosomal-protein-alanine N-acetyltransferase|uniref:ribosomal protein S18-alanine N-acetyltransferase n=1 Tax=Pacificispira sp. TaxID=2888761 RepID=UPI001B0F9F59|nr:ribosomal protein S18-alanine N-acetyltransferase [Alphaproteobacteria bacterium]